MEKYHVSIGFPPLLKSKALNLIDALQGEKIRFSFHSLEELLKENDAVRIGIFLKNYRLDFNNVFEMVENNGLIEKLGFRVNFGKNDIIFILSNDKTILTAWLNSQFDNHNTLKKELYCNVLN